jgi:hypothetical protein
MEKKDVFTVQKAVLIGLLVMMVGLAACQNEAPTPTPTLTPTAVSPTITPTSGPIATPTPSPEPTPIIPSIAVSDQTVADDGQVLIDAVTMTELGWVVLFSQRDGEMGEVIGFTQVPSGMSTDVVVEVDPLDLTSTLVAELHRDAGQPGQLDYPGADVLVADETAVSTATFSVEIDVSLPGITAADQAVLEDGLVRIRSVLAAENGWLLLHADAADGLGAVLGSVPVKTGLNENLVVHIHWRDATPTLLAVLYEDNGRSRRLDVPGDDVPVLVAGEMVATSFGITLPPDAYILDQPVVNRSITIERIISDGPAFAVVYADDNGAPGFIIGSESLQDGLNVQVVVELLETAVTPQLFILIHEDSTPGDAFDFPANDPPRLFNGRLPAPFTFQTNPGNYLVTRDQLLVKDEGETAVVVPLVVVDVPVWVAVHENDAGEVGELLGIVNLQPGINRFISVPIDPPGDNVQLMAVLYLDAGTLGIYDFPVGGDVPLQRNRRMIQSPFMLLAEGSE